MIAAVLLLPVILGSQRLIPRPPNVGGIVELSEAQMEVLPHRVAKIESRGELKSALVYESAVQYQVGDEVFVHEQGQNLVVGEKYRLPSLVALTGLFVAIVILVSGMHGVRSLFGLVFSFVVIFQFVLPQIVGGSNPLIVALLSSLLILMVTYFLSHGINAKAVIAILGTFAALIVTGILALIFGELAGLTGFGSEESGFLLETLPRASFYKLLIAGMIIGSLGVLDDITISQAAIVEELKRANHRLGIGELFGRAMRIGHDHISSLVNTLVLVYAGSALPLLLLFVVSGIGYSELLNYEALSEEIVRTLVSSIGLVTAVPLTTLIASYWYGSRR